MNSDFCALEDGADGPGNVYRSDPCLQAPCAVQAIHGGDRQRNRHDVDHPDALPVNDGVALLAGPGGVPVIFDFEGASKVIGDLSGRGPRRKGRTSG